MSSVELLEEELEYEDRKILNEHSRLLETNSDYSSGFFLYVDSLDEHEDHITHHKRFLREHGNDLRIHDRSFLRSHIELHETVLSEKSKIMRAQSFLEAEQTLAELFS